MNPHPEPVSGERILKNLHTKNLEAPLAFPEAEGLWERGLVRELED